MNKEIVLEKIIRVNKPHKLRLSATLSALSNKIDIIPTKLIEALKETLKHVDERTYVKLTSYKDKTFKTEICEKTDTQKVKLLYLKNNRDKEKTLIDLQLYAKETLGTSYALDINTRLKELDGVLNSISKSQNKKAQPITKNKKA